MKGVRIGSAGPGPGVREGVVVAVVVTVAVAMESTAPTGATTGIEEEAGFEENKPRATLGLCCENRGSLGGTPFAPRCRVDCARFPVAPLVMAAPGVASGGRGVWAYRPECPTFAILPVMLALLPAGEATAALNAPEEPGAARFPKPTPGEGAITFSMLPSTATMPWRQEDKRQGEEPPALGELRSQTWVRVGREEIARHRHRHRHRHRETERESEME